MDRSPVTSEKSVGRASGPRFSSSLLMVMLLSLTAGGGCNRQQTEAAEAPPAKIEHPVKESELTTIVLTPEAEKRLGIAVVTVEFKEVGKTRTLAGEAIVPPGASIIVSAPLAGRLAAPGGRSVIAGSWVQQGQPVFVLHPLLAPARNLDTEAERDVASARARLDAARAQLQRAEQLLRDRAGSVRSVEDATQQVAVAEAELKAAQARVDDLRRSPVEAQSVLSIRAPQAGLLRAMHAAAGETVASGAPLFEAVRLNPLWVKVPVYVGELRSVSPRSALIYPWGVVPGGRTRAARAVAAPPSADPLAETADYFFELPNSDGLFRPGQKVGVTLNASEKESSLVIPWSAVVQDIEGGAWVYEQRAPHTFARRRVEVRRVVGSDAVLSRGLARGAKIVSVGAAELFGTEFGAGK
ncbi:MAG: efflux RND transporter periplasmic adaptor subunit [Acidobacteriota bacterium]